jgi:DDE superfamily endonuclease
VVMDNLSSLYEAFPAPEAHRILRRLEFHYTPKHASGLNMVEIEIGVLRSQCLDRRIGEATSAARPDRCLAASAQQHQGTDQMDVHYRTGSHQAGTCLSSPVKES